MVGVVLAWQHQLLSTTPFLVLYAASFGFTGALSLWHSRPLRPHTVKLAAAH
jgi:hypothetical protein